MILRFLVFGWFFCQAIGAFASFHCKYSCDINRGRKMGADFLKEETLPSGDCFKRCPIQELVPLFCEFFSVILDSESKDSSKKQILKEHFLKMRLDPSRPMTAENTYGYHLLRALDPLSCQAAQTVLSTSIPESHYESVVSSLKDFLSDLKNSLEKMYPAFGEKMHQKSQVTKQLKENTSLLSEDSSLNPDSLMGVFNWCSTYCNGKKAAKTFQDLERFVLRSDGVNPGILVRRLKESAPLFGRSKHLYARKLYKCLTRCSLDAMGSYLCHLLDDIDLWDQSNGHLSKKMLDVIGQILLMASLSPGSEASSLSKLEEYLKNPLYALRCRSSFKSLAYRGENYQINKEYLSKTYLI